MSCLFSSSTTRTDVNLVDQILDQGQRLRNAMVQSIVNNDPFYSEIKGLQPPVRMHSINMDEETAKREVSKAEKHRFIAYLKGDDMSRDDEKEALNTFRAMSNADICEVTERSYASVQNTCDCDTCKEYYKQDFKNGNREVPPLNLRNYSRANKMIKKGDPCYYLKYVDTLKIAVHSLKLTEEGNMKVSSSVSDTKLKYPRNLSTTYFIDYEIPNVIVKHTTKKAKVNTGLDSVNNVKLCSKKLHKEAIYFKQISIHDVVNLDKVDLDSIDLKFQVSCRTLRQKALNVIGYAKFNMGSFRESQYLSCNQELIVFLKKDTPIVLGTINISLQLGCGQLYYGKEFLDSVSSNIENNITLPEVPTPTTNKIVDVFDDDEVLSDINEGEVVNTVRKGANCDISIEGKEILTRRKSSLKPAASKVCTKKKEVVISPQESLLKSPVVKKSPNIKEVTISTEVTPKCVLFGFIYISEVLYIEPKGQTYFTCQPFCQNDLINSNPVSGGSNPTFNYVQRIPVIYEEDFVTKLRDNFMIFEFWERLSQKEDLIGVSSIPLHQYYLAFRNPVIVKFLERNKLPVIGTDWYEPISDPTTGAINGQVQILIALGTESQVYNLESERGFRDNIVKAKKILTTRRPLLPEPRPESAERVTFKNRKVSKPLNQRHKYTELSDINDSDDLRLTTKSTSSLTRSLSVPVNRSYNIDPFIEREPVKLTNSNVNLNPVKTTADKSTHKIDTVDKASQADPSDMDNENIKARGQIIDNILQQIITQNQQNVQVETGTNTSSENINQPAESHVRSTTDLLDTLNVALNIEPNSTETFKARIIVDSALHLPSRKKCKAKKVKGKIIREELLPSTYVTFETDSEGDVKISPIVQKSTSPKWDFRCDVALPTELLVNNQKRLIFKVWKKPNNASMQPNMQVDTVLGFAALDLTVLVAGLPTVQGWFNITDFSSKCNGQIKIDVSPLEDISRFSKYKNIRPVNSNINKPKSPEIVDEPGEFLSRALKRKFTELDEITQRLRSRLSNVTNNEESDASNDDVADEFEKDINNLCIEEDYDMIDFVREAQDLKMEQVSSSLMKWQGVSPNSQLSLLLCSTEQEQCSNEKNRKIDKLVISTSSQSYVPSPQLNVNTLIINTQLAKSPLDADSSESSQNLNTMTSLESPSCSKFSDSLSETSVTALDKQLVEGRQRIDSLLQKLSLASKNDTEPFSSRYVSGCSVSQEVDPISPPSKNSTEDDIMQELGIDKHQFDATNLFDTTLIGKINDSLRSSSSTSGGSVVSFSRNERDAPDGAGIACAEKKLDD